MRFRVQAKTKVRFFLKDVPRCFLSSSFVKLSELRCSDAEIHTLVWFTFFEIRPFFSFQFAPCLSLTDWHSWRYVDRWGRGEMAPGSRWTPWTRSSSTTVPSHHLTINPDVSANSTSCWSLFVHFFSSCLIKVSICTLMSWSCSVFIGVFESLLIRLHCLAAQWETMHPVSFCAVCEDFLLGLLCILQQHVQWVNWILSVYMW